jgi:hypothetical protein
MRSPAAFSHFGNTICGSIRAELRAAGKPRAAVPTLAMPKAFYRRKLPHLQRDDKPHFLTFCTYLRWRLPEPTRSLVLESCVHDNDIKIHLHAAVVARPRPSRIHAFSERLASEIYPISEIMDAIKGASAHKINQALGRRGKVWQRNRLIAC